MSQTKLSTAELPVQGDAVKAWVILDSVHLKPSSVTLDVNEIADFRPEHIVELSNYPTTTPKPSVNELVRPITQGEVRSKCQHLEISLYEPGLDYPAPSIEELTELVNQLQADALFGYGNNQDDHK